MKAFERCLFIDAVRDMEGFRKYCRLVIDGRAGTGTDGNPRFSRIYVGAEFCVNRLPSPARTRLIAGMCADAGLDFTLVLPPAFETSFAAIDSLVMLLERGTEVVVNDWGELGIVRDCGCIPVFGRALNRVFRDPRIDPLTRRLEDLDFLRTTQVHLPAVQKLLHSSGFARVELDNVRQGINPMPPGSMPCSLYTPWTLISVSRFCGPDYAAGCPGRPCFETRTFVEGIPIIADGTCTFWFNAGLPADMDTIGIDRLVHVPGPEGLTWLETELGHPAWDRHESERLAAGNETVVGNPVERILLQALEPDFRSALQIDCGFGAHLEIIDRMNRKITGMDRSATVLDVARRRVPGAELIAGKPDDADSPGKFDLVVWLDFMNGIGDERQAAAARFIDDSLVDGGLFLAGLTASRPMNPENVFDDSMTFLWQHETPADNGKPASLLILMRKGRRDPGNDVRLPARIDAFLNKGFDSHDVDFADLTEPDSGNREISGGGWLDAESRNTLAAHGFTYVWREREGEGRTLFRLSHPDFLLNLEYSPVSQNRPHYRTVLEFNVAYRGVEGPTASLDAAIEALGRAVL